MAKQTSSGVLDGTLEKIELADEYYFTVGQPANRAAAITAALAATTPAFQAIAPGANNSRVLTIDAVTDVPVTANGSIDHAVLCLSTDSNFIVVTPLSTPLPVTSGGIFSLTAWNATQPQPI